MSNYKSIAELGGVHLAFWEAAKMLEESTTATVRPSLKVMYVHNNEPKVVSSETMLVAQRSLGYRFFAVPNKTPEEVANEHLEQEIVLYLDAYLDEQFDDIAEIIARDVIKRVREVSGNE